MMDQDQDQDQDNSKNTFEHLSVLLQEEITLREKIKEPLQEYDRTVRALVAALNKIHSTPPESLPALLSDASSHLLACQQSTASLAALIPDNQFWRWKDMWSNSIRTSVFGATLIGYLSNRTLASLSEVSDLLGIKEEWTGRFILPVEDYLHGLISLVNELSRLAVNAVTMGNFEEPAKISTFVKDIFTGFTMLNLKNDLLRRRFDSLKYDIKKIEEVVYDVSLRKLVNSQRPL